ncbi:MAG: PAS domain S-box protein [Actinobacteria bacterium]|nr:PAS domain S-box protein [Actinomycetota bacterium]
MDLDLDRFSPVSQETEPGMNLISADFDLVMVNRVNERLYGKPMVELLGKKCYREFEKREEPCPHCPGRLSLMSGESHEAETEGIRDDGTWFSARVRTHPVQGPGNQRTGFIEVVEDTTEEKRAEKLARIDSDLRNALAAADTIPKALVDCLEAALQVEGVDAGCVFSIDWSKREVALIAQRKLSPDYVAALTESALESAMSGDPPAHLARVPGAPRASELVPIVHRGQRVAVVVVGAYVYTAIPSSLRAGLHGLGATAGNAISRILAERSRGDAIADLETFITIAPLATWLLDPDGRVTMWNKAAERLLGWGSVEILGRKPPFDSLPEAERSSSTRVVAREVTLLAKDGTPTHVRLTGAPFRDLVGNASAFIVMAEDLALEERVVALQPGPEQLKPNIDSSAQQRVVKPAVPQHPSKLLMVDTGGSRSDELLGIVERIGWDATVCATMDEAADCIGRALADGTGFSAAFVELVGPDGSNGLKVKTQLRELGMRGPIIVCSDAEVLGYEFHGFAAAVKRPYDEGALRRTLDLATAVSAP